MVFSNVTFLFVFLPLVFLAYFLVPFRFKNGVLLAFSLIFYAWGEPVYILLMLYSIIVNYYMGIAIERYPDKAKSTMIFTVALNLFILGFFKYYGFLMENINGLFGLQLPIRKLALPIGISFYTFQTLSYIIDLYRGKISCQKNLVSYAAYITMFPQLIAGPIVRYSDVAGELEHRKINLVRFGEGCERFLFGLAKKVLLANTIGGLFDTVHAMGGNISVLTAWLGAAAYTFQIYFDFSGYSDMAIGLGKMFGFTFLENFDYPYISSSVTEFWRRWHISLGTWFREYVYIPLGGNRVSVYKHIRNILIVWFLTGLWHGASWNFILWGVYYGLLLLWEKYIFKPRHFPEVFKHLFTMLAVVIGWVIFSADDLNGAVLTLCRMFGIGAEGIIDRTGLYYLSTNWILLGLGLFFSMPVVKKLYQFFWRKCRLVLAVFCAALFVICVAYMVTQNYNPFLYFRF